MVTEASVSKMVTRVILWVAEDLEQNIQKRKRLFIL